MVTGSSSSLVRGSLLFKNSIWSIVAQILPMFIGLLTIPYLLEGLGLEKFGILALAWMTIGYFSLFDFGLGRALTKLVAEEISKPNKCGINVMSWTAITLMFGLSTIGSLILFALTPWIINEVLIVPDKIIKETEWAFYLLALTTPIVVVTSGFRGILEAYQRFDLIAFVRIPMGVWTFLGPLVVLFFSDNLAAVVSSLVIGRFIVFFVYFILCRYIVEAIANFELKYSIIKSLFTFGGWMTVTNIVGPMMVYFDRFFIGSFLSLSAVSYYVTPNELITRLSFLPSSIASVLFPAFSFSLANDRDHAYKLFERGTLYVFIIMFPIIYLAVIFAEEFLTIWVSPEFANQSTKILQWLSIGVLFNSIARVPFAFIQANGRPDITAKLHLIELPVYLALLWVLLKSYGVDGVAIAWMIRSSADAILLFMIVKIGSNKTTNFFINLTAIISFSLLVFFLSSYMELLVSKVLVSFILIIGFFFYCWKYILKEEEKLKITSCYLRLVKNG